MKDKKAMYALSYGLFVLTARQGDKDNGCITNTAMQVTTTPNRVTITVNKENFTHDMICETGVFNVSVLSEEADFEVFERFGFHSGRDTDKFAGFEGNFQRAENGVVYVTKGTNAYLCCKVISSMDLGTHTQFLADVVDGDVLSKVPSATYAYYQDHIKPKPQQTKSGSWVCKICGYVHEGDSLAEDFVCPLCKHPAADFEFQAAKSASWVCKICGYVYEGDPIPEDFICPLCKHPAADFERQG